MIILCVAACLAAAVFAYLWISQKSSVSDLKEKNRLLEYKLDQYDISIMLSQIQPHFLYNSLSAIRELCFVRPEDAPMALEEFSAFLRGNMDSLKSKEPVHFSRELAHVKHYLHLEKIRFGDELQIEYDIQADDFFLPTLTIQPLVENAVKYGVGNKEDGGKVEIHTRHEGDSIVITIKDDGIGFDADEFEDIPVQHDGRTHIGLSNVKSRLKAMVNGEMTIHSRKETGTVVTIVLPH